MRVALAVVLLVACRQVFGLHELTAKKDSGSSSDSAELDAPADTTAGSDAPRDSSGSDAGQGRLAGIQCGSGSACDPSSTDACCSSSSTHMCAPACGASFAVLDCDDAADCMTGKFCCGTYDSTMTVTSSVCTMGAAPCSEPPGGGIVWFCDPNAANPCPTGFTQCTQPSTLFGLPPGYYFCQ